MSARLHQEYTATVDRRMPWGVIALVSDGTEVLIDNTKTGHASLDPGVEVRLVVLDDSRTPARGSLMKDDFIIARRLRGGVEKA
ncbi:MAG: hypothetical protein K0S43_190 [Cellulosimicrobium sp.]|jgi:hypothetical protein|uniref:hypothetical protein n=1 Tax=Cellulosimicrobium cellulans TaxID=1710 RepID=UPI001C3FBC18|nr:hypothetical protein [Cellulosimicrobium cellulans]MDF2805244.1 hypothetical protein [Cellulosimicrobium sp.]